MATPKAKKRGKQNNTMAGRLLRRVEAAVKELPDNVSGRFGDVVYAKQQSFPHWSGLSVMNY